MMELKLITATLIRQFDVNLTPHTTDDSMAMRDHFLAIPQSGKCNLVFAAAQVADRGRGEKHE